MKLIQAILIPLALTLVASCGGGSVADEMNNANAKFVSVLKGIDSPESAKAAEAELTKVVETLSGIQAKMAKLSPEEMVEAAKSMASEDMLENATAMQDEMARVMADPKIMPILMPIFAKMAPK